MNDGDAEVRGREVFLHHGFRDCLDGDDVQFRSKLRAQAQLGNEAAEGRRLAQGRGGRKGREEVLTRMARSFTDAGGISSVLERCCLSRNAG